MITNVKTLGQLNLTKGKHSYGFQKIQRPDGGILFMATRDRGSVKFFRSKRDMMRHYPSVKNEIGKAL